MTETPNIRPVKWARLREALPHEAIDFTPWLARNLNLLADALGLEDLELVRTESAVESFRLDILATGTDASGEEIAVVIENQYGKSDHDHLGKLITYAAQSDTEAERVLGVWLVEEPAPAHVAAVDFLNRMSAEFVGWVLISTRFIPAPDGYYVHFQKHAEPNAFLREAPRTAGRTVTPERVEFMHAVHGLVDRLLRDIGFRNVYCHPRGSMIRAYFPSHMPAADWAEIRVLAGRDRFRVVLFVRGAHALPEQNEQVLADIRERHGDKIEEALLDAEAIDWHARGPNDRSDYVRYTWEGHGYTNADPELAAERVVAFSRACYLAISGDDRDAFPDSAESPGTSRGVDHSVGPEA